MTSVFSRRKRLIFALAAMLIAFSASAAALLATDVYLHYRLQKSAGVNIWGYRGPVVKRKKPRELRIVYLGGSTAFGYGVSWNQAIPAQLENKLNARLPAGASRVSVVNLGYNNEGAFSFAFTLDDYKYLDYDIACLYEGYNDITADPDKPNVSVFRHESPVFKLTGYLPIFPLAFREKAGALRYGGDVTAYYRAVRGETNATVFRPGLANRAAAGVLEATAAIGDTLNRQLAKATPEPPRAVVGGDSSGCKYPWHNYCRSMFTAVDRALAMGKRVLVVSQPYVSDGHRDQQQTMAAALALRYQGNPRVRYANPGTVVDMKDPLIAYDHMHLTEPGNAAIADALVEPLRALAQITP